MFFSPSLDDGFLEALKGEMPFENEVVAIKLHMGEPGNRNHLKDEEVKRFSARYSCCRESDFLIVKKEGKDVFKELNKKSFREQLKAAEKFSSQ